MIRPPRIPPLFPSPPLSRSAYPAADARLPVAASVVGPDAFRRVHPLPNARSIRTIPIEEAILRRRSRRKFSPRSEEHTSELQSRLHLVCRLLLEKKTNMRCD